MDMSNQTIDIDRLRNVILDSQHLLRRSDDSIESIVSDLCGLQYDPYPGIHLNQYIMLWNRKLGFRPEQLDEAAYRDFRVAETWTFKRNMFFVPAAEYSLYRHAAKNIERWGESDAIWLKNGDSPEIRAAEDELKKFMQDYDGLAAREIWDNMGLAMEWDKYRCEHDRSFNLPVFRAYYRMVRRGDLITCGRRSGTFREPVFILREKTGIPDWTQEPMDEKAAVKTVVDRLIASFGVTDPVHISHISGYKTADVAPIFGELESEGKIARLPHKIGRKNYYVHSSKIQHTPAADFREVRLISPMDTIVRDKAWLTAMFDYSFSFEYFKKKGMKWPLSILVGNKFAGYLDCRMDWKKNRFIVKERNIFDSAFAGNRDIDIAIEELAAFHGAKEIVEEQR